MTAEDFAVQRKAMVRAGKSDPQRTRIRVPPTLVIESVSPGHERHDDLTKREWYVEFGVPNYWILNAFSRSLKCLVCVGDEYRVDVEGCDSDEMYPVLFPDLSIPLSQLWLD